MQVFIITWFYMIFYLLGIVEVTFFLGERDSILKMSKHMWQFLYRIITCTINQGNLSYNITVISFYKMHDQLGEFVLQHYGNFLL